MKVRIAVLRYVFLAAAIVGGIFAGTRAASASPNTCGTCPIGQCCAGGVCQPASPLLDCIAADGTCASAPASNCAFCDPFGATCVSSCGSGRCGGGPGNGVSQPASPPLDCIAADGTCASAPAANCAFCDPFGATCVSSCGSGRCGGGRG